MEHFLLQYPRFHSQHTLPALHPGHHNT
ncbi:hypothetical protein E2C01_097280 [Portunus trituberculatus]|uniref:Uncharacterized protein n=1 Tax=Portunus trituberculatus TaxID=210409 RepID=A0A5B7K436_PORTR|nr:hypothetical protein [Portunus trituberculatus]